MPEPAIIETEGGEWIKVKADRDTCWLEVFDAEDNLVGSLQLDAQGAMKLAAAAAGELRRIRDLLRRP